MKVKAIEDGTLPLFLGAFLTALAVGGSLLGAGFTGDDRDPVKECRDAVSRKYDRVLSGHTMAEVTRAAEERPDECRRLTDDQKDGIRRALAEKEDRAAAHIVRVAVNEEIKVEVK
ncbi:hypothetical protein [Streptomyces sp. NPDC007984]|uniref:hypothetical protein n=1 Tax=Streptomyces sp. NPDC007984 TaxID=3364801 RepID=UPI0036E58DFE